MSIDHSRKASIHHSPLSFRQQLRLDVQETTGHQLDACSGSRGCPHRVQASDSLVERLEACLQEAGLLSFLRKRLGREPRPHNRFQVAVAECPNGCSRPQIKDMGIMAAQMPRVTDSPCLECRECEAACAEEAVRLDASRGGPVLEASSCLACGKCIEACPTGTLGGGASGYRVSLGGQLGRHPKLGRELPGIYSEDEVLAILEACLVFYEQRSKDGTRFARLLTPEAFEDLARSGALPRAPRGGRGQE